ncbi:MULTISPECIES: hypothetical protein [unclassified Pseudomonas]|uniref:hypothetical protein n=1 Tax=unclassified Pseudomonas TaxID=196821 RepID=UPI000D3AA7A3|nr:MULTISPECIES: hypothetical protein [unclassified Pseudomonas]PTT14440.1 hypothetical protein DBR14_04440 [Pseudomonas sp. HMWF034]PVV77948.1 hypothetical protein DD985_02235 [Pseudomonas sp. HMWF011]
MISMKWLFSFFVPNQAQRPRSKEASKAADELVAKPEFLNRCRERLISTMIRSSRSLTLVVPDTAEGSTAPANGLGSVLLTGKGFCVLDVRTQSAEIALSLIRDVHHEFGIGASNEGQIILSLVADEAVTPKGGLVRLITDVIHAACIDLPDSVLEAGREDVEGQVYAVIARKLASTLGQYFADNQRIPLAVARHEALKAPHLVGDEDLKSFLDKKLQKNADVLFDELYIFDTTSTYRKGD